MQFSKEVSQRISPTIALWLQFDGNGAPDQLIQAVAQGAALIGQVHDVAAAVAGVEVGVAQAERRRLGGRRAP